MATGQQNVSTPMNHPDLGPSVAIHDDRSHTLGNIFLGLACLCLGPAGVYMGSGDLAGGSAVLGWAYVAGGVVLFLYGARMAFLAVARVRHRTVLVVGRDGFEAARGDGPVGWDEVATISDPASPPGDPRMVRVQLIDPDDYVSRHALGLVSRYMLRVHQDDLFLGRDMAMPVADVQALMRKRLAEFGRLAHDEAGEEASGSAKSAAPRGRRPTRKR